MVRFGALVVLVLMVAQIAQAQTERCSAVIRAALTLVRQECADQSFARLCYGNAPIHIALTDADDAYTFTKPGDQLALALVERLELSPLNAQFGEWGIVVAKPQINFTSDAYTLLAFGEVAVDNLGDATFDIVGVPLTVQSRQGLNLRLSPDASAQQITSLLTGQMVHVSGYTDDQQWLRIHLESGVLGWASASGFGDLSAMWSTLAVVDPAQVLDWGTFGAIELRTSTSDLNSCADLPPDGILIQTPSHALMPVHLQVNGVILTFPVETTAFLQSPAEGTVMLSVVEGSVIVKGEPSLTVEATRQVMVTVGEETSLPNAYDYNSMARLPLEVLPRPLFAALDFSTLVRPANPSQRLFENYTTEQACLVGAVLDAANLRDTPSPLGRVRHTLQMGESAFPIARATGLDQAVWWKLAEDVWVSSGAVGVAGNCAVVPFVTYP
jgi:hypothetical protein